MKEFTNIALKKLQMTSAEVAVFLKMFKRMTRVERILQILAEPQCALGASQIARELNMNSVTGRLKKIFWMLLDDRIIERTELKPNSRLQKYRLTAKGRKLVASFKKKGGRK